MGLDESHRENWHGRWLFYHYLSHRETKDWTQRASPRWTTKKNHAADKRSPSISHEPERKEQVHHLELCRRKSSSPPRNWGFVGLFRTSFLRRLGKFLLFKDSLILANVRSLYFRGLKACFSIVAAFCILWGKGFKPVTWRLALGVWRAVLLEILSFLLRVVVLYGDLIQRSFYSCLLPEFMMRVVLDIHCRKSGIRVFLRLPELVVLKECGLPLDWIVDGPWRG